MFFNSEIDFINEFIASLKKCGVSEIPFDNSEFYSGIERMGQYFQVNRAVLGDVSNEISMLFIKNPFEDVYKRFRDVISSENGCYMSFVNPEYVRGVLDLTDEDADYILGKNRSGIPFDFVSNCASEFCAGAHIAVWLLGKGL